MSSTCNDISLPEILNVIGTLLDPPSLFSCVQTCKTWHHALLPFLWESIDDSLYSWPTILKQHDSQHPHNGKDQVWLQTVFTKYGHLIRNLTIHWIPILNAVGISNSCTRLSSLFIVDMRYNMPPEEKTYQTNASAVLFGNRDQLMEARRKTLPEELSLTPELGRVLRPSTVWWTTDKKREQDWVVGQRLWLLVLQNSNLRALGLASCVEYLCEFQSVDFFDNTLSGLQHLTILENNLQAERLESLLARNPTLTSFKGNIPFFDSTLFTPFPNMRRLVTCTAFSSRNFFLILHNLPNLVELACGGIGLFERSFCDGGNEILKRQPSKLQQLTFSQQAWTDAATAELVLPWVPSLKKVVVERSIFPKTTKALATFCPELEIFRLQGESTALQSIYPSSESTNHLLFILQECSKLRIFDVANDQIDANELAKTPFACKKLEIFRCQIVGVRRLSKEEEEESIEEGKKNEGNMAGVISKHQRARNALLEQQRRVFDQFASLTQLRTLDLGCTRSLASGFGVLLPIFPIMNNNISLSNRNPIPQTLELTLESGLDRLSALTKLEVFGFKGVDYRLGNPELAWMAANWPQLKILRGLNEDGASSQLESEKRQTGVRERLQAFKFEASRFMSK